MTREVWTYGEARSASAADVFVRGVSARSRAGRPHRTPIPLPRREKERGGPEIRALSFLTPCTCRPIVRGSTSVCTCSRTRRPRRAPMHVQLLDGSLHVQASRRSARLVRAPARARQRGRCKPLR